ncbi:hypothetical protein H2509_15180 [Stappia sp. F7233]|uniref:Uncharacterized protein n=1 Tax=Stappia albiluteola TaxID=2758565 RepID=A0A839AHT2_9HYPH|nr:hypothetical protein [Stappia albiluteola]MBA5778472.1 hypothetical protein [Stappia albiluteola]
MSKREELDREKTEEARRALRAVERDSETILPSSVARAADTARDHFMAGDKDPDDAIEVWGSRIGRIAGLFFAIGLVIYLAVTYL